MVSWFFSKIERKKGREKRRESIILGALLRERETSGCMSCGGRLRIKRKKKRGLVMEKKKKKKKERREEERKKEETEKLDLLIKRGEVQSR